jgi:ABC-2 type transport system permease protein
MPNQTTAIAIRVLRQLAYDRRFIVLSLAAPLVIIYMLWIFFEGVNRPVLVIIPLGAFIVHFIAYILTAIVLVRERTANTLERMFVSGYRRSGIITGYVLAYTTLATIQSLAILIELALLFDLTYGLGTFVLIYAVIWLLAIISIALGILASNFARNEGQVFPFIPLVAFPGIFFSGIIVPVGNLPGWAQPLRFITPIYYANEGIQSFIASGNRNLIVGLVIYGVIVMVLAIMTLRERD